MLDRLTRVMSPGRRLIPQIDGLRFVAISSVVLYHSSAWIDGSVAHHAADSVLASLLEEGHYGVQLFFAVSGFILALPFARASLAGAPRPPLRAYFLRRLTRLEPPYVLAMLLCISALIVFQHRTWGLWRNLAASLVYQHNVVYGTGSVVNTVAWSLEVEVQFYLLVPLLAKLLHIRPSAVRRGLLSAAIAGFGVGAATLSSSRWHLSLLGQGHFFLTGLLLADVYVGTWKEEPGSTLRWDLVSLLGWPALVLTLRLPEALAQSLMPAILLPTMAATLRGRWTRKVLANPWITTIGGGCYTIYLLHYPILSCVGSAMRRSLPPTYTPALVLYLLLALPVVLAISTVYFVAIERPCMAPDWPQALLRVLRPELHPSTRAP